MLNLSENNNVGVCLSHTNIYDRKFYKKFKGLLLYPKVSDFFIKVFKEHERFKEEIE